MKIQKEGKQFTMNKRNIVVAVRDYKGKMLKEVILNGERYKRNSVYGTYNSFSGNELLSRRDLD